MNQSTEHTPPHSQLDEIKNHVPNTIDNRPTYVYLCSPAHSGSTLIACLAAAHPQISTVGEFGATFPKNQKCSCGSAYEDCPYWNRLANIAGSLGFEFVPGDSSIRLESPKNGSRKDDVFYHQFRWRWQNCVRDWLFKGTARHEQASLAIVKSVRLAAAVCKEEGSVAFLDTTKHGGQLSRLVLQNEMPVKLITLIRDGRATICSWMKWYKSPFEEAVRNWIWSVRQAERALQFVPPAMVMHLRLEDLTREPERIIPELFRFCGADPTAPLNFDKHERHIVGNTMRHSFDGTIRGDESWREKLTSQQLSYFDRHAGRVNKKYGYE